MGKPTRPIRIEGDVAYITLTRGKIAIIDAADVPLVEGRNWHAEPGVNTFYAWAHKRLATGSYTKESMHGVIFGKAPDHEDGDGLNCRRSNLRVATVSENACNRRRMRNNTSGVKGVYPDRGVWAVRITVAGRRKFLGRYETIEQAAAAYRAASPEAHGEFGRIA